MEYLLIFIIIGFIIEKIINKKNNNTEIDNTNNALKTYKKKEKLLTQNELLFYKFLKYITDKNNLQLFTQVAMYQLIESNNINDFNKIRSKTIDFVITDNDTKIIMCIELDDNTHNQNKRKERDNFVNNLFNQLNIKLLRIKVKNYYNIEELEKQIKESL